jgi:hypothetical protein
MSTQQTRGAVFKVVDALNAPHGGRILRLRLEDGTAPSIRDLRGAHLRAVSPDGVQRDVRVEGFPLFGGRPSDDRLARSGRIDVHVQDEDGGGGPPIGLLWEVRLAGS